MGVGTVGARLAWHTRAIDSPQPSTGYELGRQFGEGAQHFWFAERSQIYPTLKRMRDRAWLSTNADATAGVFA